MIVERTEFIRTLEIWLNPTNPFMLVSQSFMSFVSFILSVKDNKKSM